MNVCFAHLLLFFMFNFNSIVFSLVDYKLLGDTENQKLLLLLNT